MSKLDWSVVGLVLGGILMVPYSLLLDPTNSIWPHSLFGKCLIGALLGAVVFPLFVHLKGKPHE